MPKPAPEPDVFRAFSDPTRRTIVELLSKGAKTVTELGQSFSISQPAISQHLKVLREAGIVLVRREGRFGYYELNPTPFKELHDWVGRYDRIGGSLE